ncbi:hypothetical protein J5500_00715 [Candidatus Saccharibacteria bacterium]|nr:hypothetical protein [Candidatus Saccharibacteria bacterium]
MRKMKIFLSLVVVLLLCASLTACADEKNSNPPDAQQDAVEIHDDDVQLDAVEIHDDDPQGDPAAGNQDDPIHHDEATDDDPMNGEGEENPGMHEGYYHEIGDAWFYTEHDLNDYIYPDPNYPGYYRIDIEKMLRDVWGSEGGLFKSNNGYSYTDGSSFSKGIQYEYIYDDYANPSFIVDVILDGDYRSTVIRWNEPKPSEGYIIFDSDLDFGLSRDMCALLLYVLEQSEANPRTNIASELNLPTDFECGH